MCRVLKKTGCSGEYGFTMIEVLGAIVILAITIVPMLGLFTIAPALHLQREYLTRAAFLAQVRTEEIRDNLIDSFTGDFNKPNGAADDFPVSEGFEPSDSGYRYTIAHDTDDELKDVTIRVWHDDDGDNSPDAEEQIITIRTQVSRRL
jgi:prepilin-type N-terminal cleavage/methylation domain-containing protein